MNPEIWTLTPDELPLLAPVEHEWIERMYGMKLTNDQAQILLHAAAMQAAFNNWVEGRKAN